MACPGSIIAVLIARTHDHVPLCSYTDDGFKSSNIVRQQEQRILERMVTPATGPSGTGCHYQSFDHKDCIYFAMQDAATDLTIIIAVNKLLVHSTGEKELNSIVCGLIDTIFGEFIQQFSTAEIMSLSVKPFQFIKFETALQKIITKKIEDSKGEGRGTVSRRGVPAPFSQLQHEIAGARDVVRKNYVDLMERGEKLEAMDMYSSQLRHESSQYYKKTVQMNRMRLWKMYGPPGVVAGVLILCFLAYVFIF